MQKLTTIPLLSSKKFQVTVAGIIIIITNRYGLDLDEDNITKIIGLIGAYVISQGAADFGKEAKQQD